MHEANSHENSGKKSGDEARRRLIAAGLEIFGRHGYEAASTRQIAESAGVNLSAITYHFGNKAKLYNAVAATIAERMTEPMVPFLEQVNAALAGSELTPDQCQQWLQQILGGLAQNILNIGQQEASLIVPFWIREQVDPTPAFDILYEKVTARVLHPCSALMARLMNRPEDDPECRIRVVSLIGQIVVFRIVRLAVLRTLGWKEYEEENIRIIREVIRQNIAAILDSVAVSPAQNSE